MEIKDIKNLYIEFCTYNMQICVVAHTFALMRLNTRTAAETGGDLKTALLKAISALSTVLVAS